MTTDGRRRVARATGLAASVALALSLASGAARADRMTDAEELFRRAKALMSDNKHREACPLFEESLKLDPQMGTLLNLAICHEGVGRIASAWGEFRAVEQQARAAGRDDRVKLAHERAARLEPRLSRIKIEAKPEARVPGLVVKIDGEAKGEPLWSGVAVDTGSRTVEASAPGKRAVSVKVSVDDEGIVVPFAVPVLEDLPPDEKSAPPKVTTNDPAQAEEQYAANRSRRSTGFVVGGLGLATAAAAGVFGVLAMSGDSDAEATCPSPCIDGSAAARSADEKTDRALVWANVANVALPVGLIAAAVGAYLVLSAGPTSGPRAASTPHVALGAGGIRARW